MRLISEIELLQKWLINHDDKELSINANSRYGILIQIREYIINKYGNDIYNEIITGKKVIKNKIIKVLSYKPEPATIQIQFSEPEHTEHLNNIKLEIHEPEIYEPEIYEPEIYEPEIYEPEIYEPEIYEPEIHEPEIHNWNGIVNSIFGTYWDYVYVKQTVMDDIYRQS